MEARESTEQLRHLNARDGSQPRIVLLGLERALFSALPQSLENEGFAPVSAPDLDEAARVAREVAPAAAIVSVGTAPAEGWDVFGAMLSEHSLHDLTLGVCVVAGGRAAFAIGLDHVQTIPVRPDAVASAVASFTGQGVADRGPVLIIDDDAARVRAIERSLSVHGLSARFARSAAEALDLAVAEEASAIVVNLMMSGCAGIDAVRRLQHERKTRHTPVIALVPDVGPTPQQCEAMMEGLGASEPASFAELALTMHELLRRKSARAVRLAAASLAYPGGG
jgi:DNA-binding response OmpR family regulator